MHWQVNSVLRKISNESIKKSDISLFWDEKENTLEFGLCLKETLPEKLNDNKALLGELKKTLKKHLQFEGACKFAEGIPF